MTAARPRPTGDNRRRPRGRALAVVAATALAATTALVAVPASAEPDASGDGWTVERVGDAYEVTVELDAPLEIRAAAPAVMVDGEEVGVAVVSEDGATLTTVTDDPAVLQADEVEAGWSGEGGLGESARVSAYPTAPAPQVAPEAPTLAVDPLAPGPYRTETIDYDLGAQVFPLPGVEPTSAGAVMGELAATVVRPTNATGPRPVVMLLHGRGTTCRDARGEYDRHPCRPGEVPIRSFTGFTSAATLLASHGYVVVSISANAVASVDILRSWDHGASARAALISEHLRRLDLANRGDASAGLPSALQDTMDLSRVGLLGHSRGGEGAVRAALDRAAAGDGVDSVMLLAPTDMARLSLPGVPTATVLPYCDGDLVPLPGQQYFDDSRHAFDDDVLRSTVTVLGANHNYFNSVWSSDDWAGFVSRTPSAPVGPECNAGATNTQRLTTTEQLRVRDAYVAGWFRLTMGGETDFLPMFDGEGAVPSSLIGTGVEVATAASAPGGSRFDVAPFTSATDVPAVDAGATARICASLGTPLPTAELPACVGGTPVPAQFPHWSPARDAPSAPAGRVLELRWSVAGRGATVEVPPAGRNVSSYPTFTFRVAAAPGLTATPDLTAVVVDGAGAAARVRVADVSGALDPLPGSGAPLARTMLRTVAVPTTTLAGQGVNLADVRRVRFEGMSATGGVILSDVAFVEEGVGTPGTTGLPSLSIEATVEKEGSGPGMALVPVRLSAPSQHAVTVSVETARVVGTGLRDALRPMTFAPGQTCLTLPVAYRGDTNASGGTLRGGVVTAGVVTGAVASAPTARLLLREDDGVTPPIPPSTAIRADPCGRTVEDLFSDVEVGTEHHESMAWLAVTGVTTGWSTPSGPEYRPLSPVNRDAMAAFLYRFAGSPAVSLPASSPFLDVRPDNLYYKEIVWLAQEGISTGWPVAGGAEFKPLQPVNRDAMAAFLYRFTGSPELNVPTDSPFADVQTNQQHYAAMAWLADRRVSLGWDVGGALPQYRPLQPVNRDAMAAFLERLTRIP